MKRLLALAAAFAAVVVVALAYLATHRSQPTPVVRGSSTKEFVTTQEKPPPPARPKKRKKHAKVVHAKVVPPRDWPTYGYDLARTHTAPASFHLRPPYVQLWEKRLGMWSEFPPSVAGGNVYVGRLDGYLYAFAGKNGKRLWSRSFGPYCTFASPTIADHVVYETFLPRPCNYGDRDKPGLIVALNARTGRVRWRYKGAPSESAPLVRAGVLYAGSWDHHLYAYDIRGRRPRVRWRFAANGELNSSPAYAGGTIFIGSRGGRVYAVSAHTGRERWSTSGFSHEDFYATPAVAYGRVFVGNTDGTMYAFGATTGHLLWSSHAGTYIYSAAAVWNKTVYVGSYDGNVYAFDAATGDVRWKRNLGASIHGAPTVLDGLVYYSTCGTCGRHASRYAAIGPRRTVALDARNGRVVWRFREGRYSPVVADGQRVYLMGNTTLFGLIPCRSLPRRARRGCS